MGLALVPFLLHGAMPALGDTPLAAPPKSRPAQKTAVHCSAVTRSGYDSEECRHLAKPAIWDDAALFVGEDMVWLGKGGYEFIYLKASFETEASSDLLNIYSVSRGGTACPEEFLALRVTETSTDVVGPFGNCHQNPLIVDHIDRLEFRFNCGAETEASSELFAQQCVLEKDSMDLACFGPDYCGETDFEPNSVLLE